MSVNDKSTTDIEKLCTENISLVYYVYWHKFEKYHEIKRRFYDEIICAGFLGLVQAARTYDPSTGNKFQTFAVASIERRMYTEARRIFRWYYRTPTTCLENICDIQDENFESFDTVEQQMMFDYVIAKVKEQLYPKHWNMLCDYLQGATSAELSEKYQCKAVAQTLSSIFAKIRKISEQIYKKETKE